MVYDAVQMFAKALTDLDRSQDVQTSSIECGGRETWQHGNSLVNYMKMVSPPSFQNINNRYLFQQMNILDMFKIVKKDEKSITNKQTVGGFGSHFESLVKVSLK